MTDASKDSRRHRPRKRFGQNFLHDRNVIAKIIAAIGARPQDHVVEIGPGQAALTRPLLESGCTLTVIELDRDLVPALQSLASQHQRLRVQQGDALKLDFASLSPAPLRVVGNLPYNISTPLLFHLFESEAVIADAHFMLQKEVVERMAAAPGSKRYGRLSVMTQYHSEVESLFDVAPGCFNPPPKVTSAVVRLRPRSQALLDGPEQHSLATLVNAAFSKRRKTLSNALKGLLSAEQIHAVGIEPGLRAEALDLEAYLRLARLHGQQAPLQN